MPFAPAVRLRLRDGSVATKALPIAGVVTMADVAPEIAHLASRLTRFEQDPWIECDCCVWVRLEHVVAIEPVDEP
jgi:hypothetical protein